MTHVGLSELILQREYANKIGCRMSPTSNLLEQLPTLDRARLLDLWQKSFDRPASPGPSELARLLGQLDRRTGTECSTLLHPRSKALPASRVLPVVNLPCGLHLISFSRLRDEREAMDNQTCGHFPTISIYHTHTPPRHAR